MRLALVTAFPPSHERINEYGFHLANELQKNPLLSVSVLADKHGGSVPELSEFHVIRCWKPNSLLNAISVLRAIRQERAEVVWFNLVFSTFGTNPIAAFLGLCIPALARLLGCRTHVTLHHIMEMLSLEDAGIRHRALYRIGGWLGTRVLLMANSVTVLLPEYRQTLINKYRGRNVHLRAHGVFSSSLVRPDFSRRGSPHRILAFGKWGTYKRVELLIEAFTHVRKRHPDVKLVIAGENHPATPGYVESIRSRFGHFPGIEITGYVAEEELPDLFASATAMVMPYTSAGGSSGVAHLACQFGVPIICADIPDFRDMAEGCGMAIDFYRNGNSAELAKKLEALLADKQRQYEMAEQNFSAALRLTMPHIIGQYVRSFDWYGRRRARFQRPAWAWRTAGQSAAATHPAAQSNVTPFPAPTQPTAIPPENEQAA
jgi:glycosyltransferase involved in cell wall biosynthesis